MSSFLFLRAQNQSEGAYTKSKCCLFERREKATSTADWSLLRMEKATSSSDACECHVRRNGVTLPMESTEELIILTHDVDGEIQSNQNGCEVMRYNRLHALVYSSSRGWEININQLLQYLFYPVETTLHTNTAIQLVIEYQAVARSNYIPSISCKVARSSNPDRHGRRSSR